MTHTGQACCSCFSIVRVVGMYLTFSPLPGGRRVRTKPSSGCGRPQSPNAKAYGWACHSSVCPTFISLLNQSVHSPRSPLSVSVSLSSFFCLLFPLVVGGLPTYTYHTVTETLRMEGGHDARAALRMQCMDVLPSTSFTVNLYSLISTH